MVRKIVAREKGQPIRYKIDLLTLLDEGLCVDSLGTLKLVDAIQKELGFTTTLKEDKEFIKTVRNRNMLTVGDIYNYAKQFGEGKRKV